MAGKLCESNPIAERRLRPIYEFLESGNSKKALQEADKVLKKHPNFQCAKVLKGLALLRIGRDHECEKVLEAVLAENPVDDTTLQAMTVCYRDLQKPEMICQIYEKAVSKEPNSEELLSHLFMSYVRIGDYQKQKQTALQLYKFRPKNPYYFWAVMSIVMQARTADSQATKGIILSLAERMISKFIKEEKIETEQEVQLYLMVLEMQGKFKEALDVINGPLGNKLDPHLVTTSKRTNLMIELGLWKEVNVYLKEQLLDEIDAWSNYLHYFSSVMHIVCETDVKSQDMSEKHIENGVCNQNESKCDEVVNEDDTSNKKCEQLVNGVEILPKRTENICDKSSKTEDSNEKDGCYFNGTCNKTETINLSCKSLSKKNCESVKTENKNLTPDDSFISCVKFLERLQAENKRLKHALRGPYLAPLEFYFRLVEKKIDPVPIIGDLVSLLVYYYKQFGSKQCCISDIQKYLDLLDKSQMNDFFKQIEEFIGLKSGDFPSEVIQMQRHISFMQISRYLGFHFAPDVNKMELAILLWRYFLHGVKLNEDLSGTNIGLSDMYALLAAYVLYDLWVEAKSHIYLNYAIGILQHALLINSSNYQFKLLLFKFYSLLGGTKTGLNLWELLDIKHVQLVSLGYLIHSVLLKSALFTNTAQVHEATLKFYQSNIKDNSDFMTISSYKFGSFLKIEEFLDFRDKLNNSLQHYLVQVENFLLETYLAPNQIAVLKKVLSSSDYLILSNLDTGKLEDNRDFSVFNICNSLTRGLTPELISENFNQEICLLKLRILILRCLTTIVDSGRRNSEALCSLRQEIEGLHNQFNVNKPPALPQEILSGLSKSRLLIYVESEYYLQYLCHLLSILELLETSNTDAVITKTEAAILLLENSVKKTVLSLSSNLDLRLQEMEQITILIEMFCLSAVFSGVFCSVVKNEKLPGNKGGKKKNKRENMPNTEQRSNPNSRKVSYSTIFVVGVMNAGKELEETLNKLSESWSVLPEFDFSPFFDSPSISGWTPENSTKLKDTISTDLSESFKSFFQESLNVLSQKLKFVSELNSEKKSVSN